ncbi:MAG: helix-turn-helix domain-containing protein [Planctomycetota bacterium]|jgi:hypothetical protein
MDSAKQLILMPILPGDPPQPCPELLTEEEAIRYLRLDTDGPAKPELTLRHYREKGSLRATRIGRKLRYRRVELDRLMENETQK